MLRERIRRPSLSRRTPQPAWIPPVSQRAGASRIRLCAALVLLGMMIRPASAQAPAAPGPAPEAAPCKTLQRAMDGLPQHIVAYGTSLTWAGSWVEHLRQILNCKQSGYNFTICNMGKNSKASDWGVRQLEARVLKRNPDAVFLEFGINDGDERHRISLEQSRSNLIAMIDGILTHNPDCDVILLTMNPVVGKPAEFRPRLDQYYQVARDVARERGLRLVDLYPIWETMLREEPETFNQYVRDGLHPGTEAGIKIVAPAIARAMGL